MKVSQKVGFVLARAARLIFVDGNLIYAEPMRSDIRATSASAARVADDVKRSTCINELFSSWPRLPYGLFSQCGQEDGQLFSSWPRLPYGLFSEYG